MTTNRELIEDAGWSVLFLKNKVAIEHPVYGKRNVCDKRLGEWDYERELGEALVYIHTQVERESYQKKKESIPMWDTKVIIYEGDKTMSNPFIQYLAEKHEADNAKVTDKEKAFIDALDTELIVAIMEKDSSIDKFTKARDKGRYLRCKNMLELRQDKIAKVSERQTL